MSQKYWYSNGKQRTRSPGHVDVEQLEWFSGDMNKIFSSSYAKAVSSEVWVFETWVLRNGWCCVRKELYPRCLNVKFSQKIVQIISVLRLEIQSVSCVFTLILFTSRNSQRSDLIVLTSQLPLVSIYQVDVTSFYQLILSTKWTNAEY